MNLSQAFGQFASEPSGGPVPPSAVGPDFDIYFHTLVDTSGNAVQLFGGNPNRIAVLVPAVGSAQQIFYGWFDFASQDEAILQVNGLPSAVYTFRDLGPLVTRPFFYSISLFGAGPTIIEVIYHGGNR